MSTLHPTGQQFRIAHGDAEVHVTEVGATLRRYTVAVRPQPGYEWALQLRVGYHLDDDGLRVELTATNTGHERAPFGAGFHPYLRIWGGPVDDLWLAVPARCRVLADADGSREDPVDGTEWDLRSLRRIGTLALDTAYGGLVRHDDGRAVAVLADGEGTSAVRLWVDEAFGYLMVYTADEVHSADRRRRAVAVEPMSCPPQAFRTGTDVVDLEPGGSWHGRWGLSPELRA